MSDLRMRLDSTSREPVTGLSPECTGQGWGQAVRQSDAMADRRLVVVVPRVVWLTSVATGQRTKFLLHCVDPITLVIGVTWTDRSVAGHPFAGARGVTHQERSEYAPDELGTFEFWPDRRTCRVGEVPDDTRSDT